MMIWKYVFGVLGIFFGTYQMVNSFKYVKMIQKHGNKSTSSFVGYAVWYSFAFGLGISLLGIALTLNAF